MVCIPAHIVVILKHVDGTRYLAERYFEFTVDPTRLKYIILTIGRSQVQFSPDYLEYRENESYLKQLVLRLQDHWLSDNERAEVLRTIREGGPPWKISAF